MHLGLAGVFRYLAENENSQVKTETWTDLWKYHNRLLYGLLRNKYVRRQSFSFLGIGLQMVFLYSTGHGAV